MKALPLLLLLLAVPCRAKPAKMTPELKARLDAISVAEKTELKPLVDKERALRKQRDALAAAKAKAHQPPVKSKAEAAALSKEIAADPEIAKLETDIKAARRELMDKRAGYSAQRKAAAAAP